MTTVFEHRLAGLPVRPQWRIPGMAGTKPCSLVAGNAARGNTRAGLVDPRSGAC